MGVAAAVAVIYARSTSAYFFDDDFHWLAQTQSFAAANMFDLSRYDHFYRPVIETYFFVGLSLFGCDPFPFHLASIAIHLVTTLLVFLLAHTVARSPAFAFLTAVFFAVQPGFTDAVTWIAAITDLLPGLWYVLAVWLHVRFVQARRPHVYAGALAAFVACHLTHESAATLLPMMLIAEATFGAAGSARARVATVASHWARYVPFAAVLLAFLAVTYIVNTRSYLVQEGHYAIGWHAVPNLVNYVIWLYVGQRAPIDYVATIGILGAIAVWGSPRMRFAVAWVVVTLMPVAFFTWENAPRYLYLPAAGFALLTADLMLGLRGLLARWWPRAATPLMVAVVALLAIRFGVFAKKAADSFPSRTVHYARFAEELRRANPSASPGATVFIDARFLEGVPELYREPAARIALCMPDLRLQLR